MPGPKPRTIELTEAERQGLEALARRHHTQQQIALRGRIVLAAAGKRNNAQIARALGVDVDTARLWRKRWLELQPIALADLSVAERLEDLPRDGAPARITTDQVCAIQAVACEKPEDSERPISHPVQDQTGLGWSAREIADEIIQRGIVEYISPRHAARLLKKGPCSPTASATG